MIYPKYIMRRSIGNDHVIISQHFLKGKRKILTVGGITIIAMPPIEHIPGVNMAHQFAMDVINGERDLKAHFFIDGVSCWQIIKTNRQGSFNDHEQINKYGATTTANESTIGIVIMNNDDNTIKTLTSLVAQLCYTYNLNPRNCLYSNEYWTNHGDLKFSAFYWDDWMEEVVDKVTDELCPQKQTTYVMTSVSRGVKEAYQKLLELNNKGFKGYIVRHNGLYKIRVGDGFTNIENTTLLIKQLENLGFHPSYTTNPGELVNYEPPIIKRNKCKLRPGMRVQLARGSKDYRGQRVPNYFYTHIYTVDEVEGNKVYLSEVDDYFNLKDLIIRW